MLERKNIYRPDIDGLRAFAVLSVLTFHISHNLLPGGFVGVDVFFVISGYLITGILLNDPGNLVEFYSRRVRRLFPALIVVLVACYIAGQQILTTDERNLPTKHISAGAFFVSNFVLWGESGYFDIVANQKALLHLWSLAIEEQFYLVWPGVLLLGLATVGRRAAPALIVAVFVVSFPLSTYLSLTDHVAAFFSPFSRAWEFSIGAILALPSARSVVNRYRDYGGIVSVCGLGLLFLAVVVIDGGSPFPGALALLPTLGAALVIAAGPDAWVNKRLFSNRAAVWAGLISYPLYLWHWPVLTFARISNGGEITLPIGFALGLFSVLLAWLTYRFVEQPVRRSKAKLAPVAALASAMLIAGGFTGLKSMHATAEDQLQYVADDKAFSWPYEKISNQFCRDEINFKATGYCLASSREKPTVALVGDSHANAIYEFMDHAARERGERLIMLGQGGCPPLLGVERDSEACPASLTAILGYLESEKSITRVFIAGRYAAALTGVDFGGNQSDYYRLKMVNDPDLKDRTKIFEIGLRSLIAALQRQGKTVTVLLDVPEIGFDPKSCMVSRGGRNCSVGREVVEDRQKQSHEIIEKLESELGFSTIDLAKPFCNEEKCTAEYRGYILYRDHHHIGVNGNRFLADLKIEVFPSRVAGTN